MRPLLPALALLMLGSSAFAGPKPPATNVFEPEIGYTYASGNYMDLRLANRAGDKAVLVHRTAFGALGSFDLSDEASKRIAYQDGGKLYVRSWQTTNGAVSIGAPSLIFAGPGRAESMDVSPDGSKLAFSVNATPDFPDYGGIGIYYLNSPSPADPVILTGWQVFTVRWHPTEDQIVLFVGRRLGTTEPLNIHRFYPANGGVELFLALPSSPIEFDVTRPSATIFGFGHGVAFNYGSVPRIYFNTTGYGQVLAEGTLAHFNCRNDAIIHRAFATRRPPTRISYLRAGDGATQFDTWSTDSNIHHTDWMPRVPCA